MKKIFFTLAVIIIFSLNLFSQSEIVKIKSNFTYYKTLKKLQFELGNKGFTIIKNIDFKNRSVSVKAKILPATLIIFTKKSIESKFVRFNTQSALEFPFRILVWKDRKNNVWVSYKNFKRFEKYDIPQTTIVNLNKLIGKIILKSTKKNPVVKKIEKNKKVKKVLQKKLEKN